MATSWDESRVFRVACLLLQLYCQADWRGLVEQGMGSSHGPSSAPTSNPLLQGGPSSPCPLPMSYFTHQSSPPHSLVLCPPHSPLTFLLPLACSTCHLQSSVTRRMPGLTDHFMSRSWSVTPTPIWCNFGPTMFSFLKLSVPVSPKGSESSEVKDRDC